MPWASTGELARERARAVQAFLDRPNVQGALAAAAGVGLKEDPAKTLCDVLSEHADFGHGLAICESWVMRFAGGAYSRVSVGVVGVMGHAFKDVANAWTSGELAKKYSSIAAKDSAALDAQRLRDYVLPLIGDKPIAKITRDDCEAVLSAVPERLAAATKRQVGQVMRRVFALAIEPLGLIERNPCPKPPKVKETERRPQEMLRTVECDRFLACADVPIEVRVFVAFLSREGMREDEASSLAWADVDLEHGFVRLHENKTDHPRTWALERDTFAMLARWFELKGAPARDTLVFTRADGSPLALLTKTYRRWLLVAGIHRAELHEGTKTSDVTAFHALRALMVTNALATGRTEEWVRRRTGHTTSDQVQGYNKPALTFEEARLPSLQPLDQVLAWPGLANEPVNGGLTWSERDDENVSSFDGFRCVDSNHGSRIQSPSQNENPAKDRGNDVKLTSLTAAQAPSVGHCATPVDQSGNDSGPVNIGPGDYWLH